MKRVLLLFFLASITYCGKAQVDDIILFENFTNEDGLAQSSIRGFAQDNTGFIWIATAEGLHRYNGYSFRIFKNNPRDTSSLVDNNLTAIALDQRGFIWLGTDAGHLDRFDRKTLRFEHIHLPWNEETGKYPISTIYHHPLGYTLVGLDGGGVVIIDRKTLKSRRFTTANSGLPNNFVNCFSAHRNNKEIWIGTQQGVVLVDPSSGRFSSVTDLDVFDNQNVTGILHAITRVYFTTKGQGLQIWNSGNGEITSIPSPKIRSARFQTFIMMDRDGILWIGTEGGGLLKYTAENGFQNYRNQPYVPTSLIGDHADCGFVDKDGNLWFGLRNGISRYDKSLKVFNLVRNFEHEGTPTNNNVYCIYEDRMGTIWIGTITGGLARFDRATGELKVYPVIRTADVETRAVRSIFEDRNGKLWIGTRDEGLFSFDRDTEKFTHYPSEEKVRFNTIRHIMEDTQGNMWLGTHWGLSRFDRETGTFSTYKSEYLSNNPIYQIYEDKKRNELLIVTFRSGLHIFHKDRRAFTVMRHSEDSSSPSVNAMMCIEPMGNDSFLIGTYDGGLNIFDRKTLRFSDITVNDGLPNNVIYGILRSGPDEYWVSTNHGISRVNLKTMKFKNFNLSHYLQGWEYNEGAYCKASDGTFYFGGINGFNFFRPGQLSLNMKPPPVALTAFRIMDKEVSFDKDIQYVDEIEISYRENLISFEYAALNYTNSRENRYAYMMDGYDDSWIYAGSRRSAYYTRLAPGTYTFRVKASNNNGIWNEEGTSVKVVIKPPYYLTWWFIVLASIVVVFLIIITFRLRTKNIARSYEYKLTEMELRALRSQMNPHFIFNSLNSIQYFVLNKKPEEAYSYLAKFSSLMRMILQNSALKYISLQAEYDWLKTYLELEKMRMDYNFDYTIQIEDHIDPAVIQIPSMLVQPYVENAIIHGLMHKEGDRKLSIEFKKAAKSLICIVEDNGIGREESSRINMKKRVKHKSHGMKLTRDRLDILSRDQRRKPDLRITDLFDEEGEPAGTRVVITVPLGEYREEEDLTKEE